MQFAKYVLALYCACFILALSGCAAQEPDASTSSFLYQSEDHQQPVTEHEAVDAEWFSNTAMIGHSLMRGMELYSGLDTPDYYTLTGGSVSELLTSSEVTLPTGGTGRLSAALEQTSYERFYLFMGINEIAGELDTLKSHYEELIQLVRDNSEDASIYILAVLPVTEAKASGGTFTLERITAYNDMLQTLCKEQNCWYVDLYTAFAQDDGYLPSDASTDGVHLQESEYPVIFDYLKTHTID